MSKFTLMHKDIPVVDCEFSDGYLLSTGKLYENNHLPLGCKNMLGYASAGNLRDWWNRRSIPSTRYNAKDIQSILKSVSFQDLTNMNFGCNLSDHYWIKPFGSDLKYTDVNLFENDFSQDMTSLFLLGRQPVSFDMITAGCSTGGDVPKAWQIEDNIRKLYKVSGSTFGQEPYNEVIASDLNKAMSIDHVEYRLKKYEDTVCSVCDCMINLDCEMIPAYDIIKECSDFSSPVQTYVKFAEDKNINIRKSLSDMVVSDFLMRNTDRHWNNFGLIRDANDLHYIKAIDLFDYGNSLFHNNLEILERDPISKFSGASLYHDLRYASAGYTDISKAEQFDTIVHDILSKSHLPLSRVDAICDFAENQSSRLMQYFDMDLKGKTDSYDFEQRSNV